MAFTTHDEYIESNKSEKIILAQLHGFKRLYNFVADTGVYSRTTPHFVSAVKKETTSLTRVTSLGALTDDTKYYYDINLSKLYLYDFDQDTDEVIVEYRFFFSNVPMNLSWDLTDDAGDQVEYEPRIITVPKFKSQMSQGKKGINLIGKGSFKINNNDGEYDDIYDTIFFDNKAANIYSFNRDLAASEAKQIFRGIVTGKSFSTSTITFNVNDDLYKLDESITATQYGSEVRDEDAQRYKRVLYGRNDNVLCQSLDQYGDGVAITGTVTGVSGNEYVTGSGTSFIDELTSGDELIVNGFSTTVEKVKSDTLIIVNELEATFSGLSATVIADIQYKAKNRTFQVAGHALKKASTTISSITSGNRIAVADSDGFEADDIITVDGETATIRRVSGTTIVLTRNLSGSPAVSDTVTKREIFSVRYGEDETPIDDSDITISNASGYAKFTIADDAEINAAKFVRNKENFSFFNGRDTVWLGTPAIYELTAVANTAGSLYGTYFIIKDIDGNTTGCWFNNASESITEPSHGADDDIAIILTSNTMTSTLVAEACLEAIVTNVDYYQGSTTTDVISLESKTPSNILTPTVNTSGFSIASISTGVTVTSDVDLTTLIKPRDYIKKGTAADVVSYEVLSVEPTSIRLRSNYAETDATSYLKYKSVKYIGDDTQVYVNCLGKTKDGTPTGDFIKTGPEVVEDILTDVGLSAYLDTSSFTDAVVRAPQLMSLAIPADFTGAPESAKNVINVVNKTLLGSLFINTDLELGYDILDSEIPLNTLNTIYEEDLVKWSVKADGFDISKSVIGRYRHLDYDPNVDDESSSEVTYTSDFVNKYIGNNNTSEVSLALYETSDAQELIERDQFVNSLSNSIIKISGKLTLSKYNLGERVLLDLNRLYVALGSTSNTLRVGIITSMNNTGEKVELEIEDLGGLYSRAARVTDSSAPDYDASTDQEKVVNSHITGNNDIIDTDEDTFSTNLIS